MKTITKWTDICREWLKRKVSLRVYVGVLGVKGVKGGDNRDSDIYQCFMRWTKLKKKLKTVLVFRLYHTNCVQTECLIYKRFELRGRESVEIFLKKYLMNIFVAIDV